MSLPIDHRAGTQLGPFVLGNVVGQGGMGVVYSATKGDTGEIVAVKLMSPELSSSEEFRQRFLNEAAVGPIMDHPNVVPIYGSGDVDGELYIAMKFIDGRNLKEVLKEEGPLEPKRALRIFRQVASALDAAHESGMVHRDIKPQNILLATDDGSHDLAYVSDFGLVKPMSSDTSASRTGQVFGSLPYMAPEQIEALEMDGRADVYALACVLFESLTGRPPFERPNEVAVVWAHIHEQPPFVTELKKELPGGIDGVVMQAMSKHPDDRFLTCGEFVEAFEQGLGRQKSRVSRVMRPLVARTERPKTEREVWGPNFFPELSRIRKVQRKVDWVRTAAVVAGLSLAATAATQFAHPQGLSGAVEDVSNIVEDTASEVVDLVAGEGRSDDVAENSTVLKTRLGGGETRKVRGPAAVGDPDTHVEKPTSSGVLPPDSMASVVDLTDTRITFSSGRDTEDHVRELYAINADGSGLRRITTGNAGDDYDADWSPFGKLAFSSNRGGNYDIYIMNNDGTDVERITTTPGTCDALPRWSPDGRHLLFSDSCDLPGTGERDIWVVDVVGGTVTNLTPSSATEGGASWSPDGSQIVFDSDRDGNRDLYVMDADGGNVRRLTQTAESELFPDWGPSGKIAYVTTGDWDTWVMNADGSGRKKITAAPDRNTWPSWSPDGRKIAFWSKRSGQGEVWIMDADGSDQRLMAPDLRNAFLPHWERAHYRAISVDVRAGRLSGGLSAPFYAGCAWRQPVVISKRVNGDWKNVGRTHSDDEGQFELPVDADGGTFRVKAPLTRTARGFLCGPAESTIRS